MQRILRCPRCGNAYISNGINVQCTACDQKDERTFMRIRSYLINHPNASILEVSSILNVNIEIIRKYLKQSRLEIVEEKQHFLTCEKCKRSIHYGTLCGICSHAGSKTGGWVSQSETAPSMVSKNLSKPKEDLPEIKLKFITSTLGKYKKTCAR